MSYIFIYRCFSFVLKIIEVLYLHSRWELNSAGNKKDAYLLCIIQVSSIPGVDIRQLWHFIEIHMRLYEAKSPISTEWNAITVLLQFFSKNIILHFVGLIKKHRVARWAPLHGNLSDNLKADIKQRHVILF